MNIIDGKKIAQKIRKKLKNKIAHSSVQPGLGVILVGDDPASRLYVSLKEKTCREVGIKFKKFVFPADTPTEQIIKRIKELNQSPIIQSILVQLPLPTHLPTNKIIEAIDPQKDVDGFHPQNIKKIMTGQKTIEPVLTKAIWLLIQNALQNKNKSTKQKCAILGKSDIFTSPLQKILVKKNIETDRLSLRQLNSLKSYDIIIVAIGKPNILNGRMFKNNAIIIDVGINKLKNGRVVGDVNFPTTLAKNGWITPVPGGVGPMTVAMLLENTYLLAKKYANKK